MAKKVDFLQKFWKKNAIFYKKKEFLPYKCVRDWNHAVGGHWTERRRRRKTAAE
jgi:hypothetical protein